MNLQRIKHMLFRLSTEEKVLGIGALLVIVSSFLPWYSVVLTYNEQGNTESGFSGDLGVIGFVVFLLVLISLAFMLSEYLHFKLPQFGFKKEKIILFLMGESAFLVLLTLAIYTKRSIDYTNAELRFGLYLSLIGAFMGTFAAYAQIQRLLKKNAQEFFDLPGDEPSDNNPEPENDPDEKVLPEVEEKHIEKHSKSAHKPKQESFFEEDNGHKEEINNYAEETENKEITENYFEEEIEPEIIHQDDKEEIEEAIEPEIIHQDDIDLGINDDALPNASEIIDEDREEKQLGQGSYFLKDAGIHKQPTIKVDIESIKVVEKNIQAPDEPAEEPVAKSEQENEKLSFYNDL